MSIGTSAASGMAGLSMKKYFLLLEACEQSWFHPVLGWIKIVEKIQVKSYIFTPPSFFGETGEWVHFSRLSSLLEVTSRGWTSANFNRFWDWRWLVHGIWRIFDTGPSGAAISGRLEVEKSVCFCTEDFGLLCWKSTWKYLDQSKIWGESGPQGLQFMTKSYLAGWLMVPEMFPEVLGFLQWLQQPQEPFSQCDWLPFEKSTGSHFTMVAQCPWAIFPTSTLSCRSLLVTVYCVFLPESPLPLDSSHNWSWLLDFLSSCTLLHLAVSSRLSPGMVAWSTTIIGRLLWWLDWAITNLSVTTFTVMLPVQSPPTEWGISWPLAVGGWIHREAQGGQNSTCLLHRAPAEVMKIWKKYLP